MSINVVRKVITALLISTALTLAGAAPSQARIHPQRNFGEPARNDAPRGFIASVLRYVLELAGGAMDPNGSH
jgi:hypothetical protein